MILVAVGLVVIMAMAALVIDVGAMEHERRELQNGADAAAMSRNAGLYSDRLDGS